MNLHEETRGGWTLALCLTAPVGMTLAIFCRLVSKTNCCRLNELKSRGLTLTQYLTMHVSILDDFRHLSFKLSRPSKVKCDGGIGLPIYDLLLMFNSNIGPNYAAPFQDIRLQNQSDLEFDLSMSLQVRCDSLIGLPIYAFLLMFNSNICLTLLLYKI